MAALCLDIHARYQCRHAGACCENWTVPAEPRVVELVRARAIRRDGVSGALFVSSPVEGAQSRWTVARDDRGECVFFDRRAGRLCVIHRDLGMDALPSACRHFPRKVLQDPRGTLISLSHFCPTAAATLLTFDALSIVDARPPLRLAPPMEGLDASDALPPLLRPGLLCDIAGYEAWERAAVATFARSDLGHDTCLDSVAAATEIVRDWKPGKGSLADRVRTAFDETGFASGARSWSQNDAIRRVAALTRGRVGEELASIDAFQDKWDHRVGGQIDWFDHGMRNYLAARLFGNWIAYQGRGLRSIVEWLRTCAAVVRHQFLDRLLESGAPPDEAAFIEAVRSADLLLLHVLDSAAFARQVASIEELTSA